MAGRAWAVRRIGVGMVGRWAWIGAGFDTGPDMAYSVTGTVAEESIVERHIVIPLGMRVPLKYIALTIFKLSLSVEDSVMDSCSQRSFLNESKASHCESLSTADNPYPLSWSFWIFKDHANIDHIHRLFLP